MLAGGLRPRQLMCQVPSKCAWLAACRASLDSSPRHGAAHSNLHRSTWAECCAHLRAHMVATAAKDCTVMLSLARADNTCATSQATDVPLRVSASAALTEDNSCRARAAARERAPQSTDSCGCDIVSNGCTVCEQMLCAAMEGDASAAAAASTAKHTCVQRIEHRGRRYSCRVAVVDLDRKPLSKIDKHMRLDQDICKLHMQRHDFDF